MCRWAPLTRKKKFVSMTKRVMILASLESGMVHNDGSSKASRYLRVGRELLSEWRIICHGGATIHCPGVPTVCLQRDKVTRWKRPKPEHNDKETKSQTVF